MHRYLRFITLLAVAAVLSACHEHPKAYYFISPIELRLDAEFENIEFSDNKLQIVSGTVKSFRCEGQDVALKSTKMDDGFVHTRKFGSIQVIAPYALQSKDYGFAITEDQKAALYKFSGRRYPVSVGEQGALKAMSANSDAPNISRRRGPLEGYNLRDLAYVGNIDKGKVRFAIIKAPDNSLYRISVGEFIGMEFGKIVEITDHTLQIVELTQGQTGEWVERMATLGMEAGEQRSE
jgi:type IV pilus assembly protein PilP